jgi:hypothetical protein
MNVKKMIANAVVKLCALCFMVFTTQAQALVVLQQGYVPFGVEYDTNPTLSSNNSQSIWRYTATPRYVVSAVENQNRWYADAGIRLQRSSDKRVSIDREDPNIIIGWENDSERGRFSLVGRYNKTSTRFTEFDGTGLVTNDGSAIARSISANWSRLLTEKLNFSIGGQYLKTAYSGGTFTNFATKSLNSTLTYELNEKVSPFIQVGLADFNPEGQGRRDTQSQDYLIGANVTLTPQFNFSAATGINHVSSSGSAWVGNTSFNYLEEKHSFRGALARNVSVSSIGNFQEADRLSLGYGYDLTDKSRLGTDLTWRRNNSLNSNEAKQITGFYSRDLSEFWQMRLSLQHRNLKSVNRSANGNVVGIAFTYNTPEF